MYLKLNLSKKQQELITFLLFISIHNNEDEVPVIVGIVMPCGQTL